MGVFSKKPNQSTGEEFDPIKAEQNEIDTLLDRGVSFTADGQTYIIRRPFLSTLLLLADQFIKLDIDDDALASGDVDRIWDAQKKAIIPNAKICAMIVAIVVLRRPWKIALFGRWYARKFLGALTPSDLYKITGIILKTARLQDFINSITLLRVNRITAPTVIED